MTKQELANRLSARVGMTQVQALQAIEAIMAITTETFCEGHNLYLRGFGTLKVVTRKARSAQNIRKGETVLVPTHKTVKFVPSPVIKNALNDL